MKKLIAIIASALTLGAFANSAADPVITADTSAVDPGTTCTVMAGDEEAFDFVTNGGDMTFELDEAYVGRRVCLAVGGEEITDSTLAQMGAANVKLGAIKTVDGEINVGDQLTWSNAQFVGQEGYSVNGGSYPTPKISVPAKDGLPAGTVLRVNEISFAQRAGYTGAKNYLLIGSQTDTTKASDQVVVDSENTLGGQTRYKYTFAENDVTVVVGTGATPMYFQTNAGSGDEWTQLQVVTVNNDNKAIYQDNGIGSWCIIHELKATVVSFPPRDPVDFVWSIAEGSETAAWTPSQPTELIVGDTITIEAPDAELNGEIPCHVTITAEGSLTVNGSTAEETDPITVNATNAGTLKTTGKVALAGSSSGTLEVVSGTTSLDYGNASKALSGNVTIDADATMLVSQTDSLDYNGSATVKVYGTLDLGAKRWSMGANNKLFVYSTGLVKGSGEAGGALDYFTGGNRLVISGNGEISAKIGIRNANQALNLAQTRDSTFKMSGPIVGAGNLVKTFATTAEGNSKGDAGNAYIEFSGASTFTGTLSHEPSCGTIRFMPGCSMSASSITVKQGTALTFGSAVADGEVTISGSVTYANTANEPQVFVNTSIGGAFVSATKRVKIHGKTLSMGEGSSIELTSDSTGTVAGTGTIKWPINGNPGISVADGWAGTIETKVLSNQIQLLNWMKAGSTVKTEGLSGNNTYIGNGGSATYPGTLELVNGGAFTLNNGNSGSNYIFTKICGTGTFAVEMRAGVAPLTYNITTLEGNVALKANRTLNVTTVVTTLAEQPTVKTKVVALVEGTTIANIATTAFKLSDGETALDGTITTEGEGDDYGVYVTPESSELPGEELIPDGEKEAYRAWASANDVTVETTTSHDVLAIAFHLEANKGDTYDTIEDAAQAKVKELVAQIDLAALADPEGGEEAALDALNTELAEKGLVASLAPVELEGASESTKLYQLVIKLKEEN